MFWVWFILFLVITYIISGLLQVALSGHYFATNTDSFDESRSENVAKRTYKMIWISIILLLGVLILAIFLTNWWFIVAFIVVLLITHLREKKHLKRTGIQS